jgi:hypothetical protein
VPHATTVSIRSIGYPEGPRIDGLDEDRHAQRDRPVRQAKQQAQQDGLGEDCGDQDGGQDGPAQQLSAPEEGDEHPHRQRDENNGGGQRSG